MEQCYYFIDGITEYFSNVLAYQIVGKCIDH